MIKCVDANFRRIGVIKNIITAKHREEVNGEFTIDFETVLSKNNKTMITQDSIFEVYGQYFDIGFFEQGINDDGQYIIRGEADHISYRLNQAEYDLEPYVEEETGLNSNGDVIVITPASGFEPVEDVSPSELLSRLLAGTPFTGTITVDLATVSYSVSGSTSRREAIMNLAEMTNGEIIWNNFHIQIVQHRGSTASKVAIIGKNLISITKSIDKRVRIDTEDKDFTLTYDCEIIDNVENETYNLGDDVRILDHDLSIDTMQRVVAIESNPDDENEPRLITLGDISKRDLSSAIGEVVANAEGTGSRGPRGPEGPAGPPGPQGYPGDNAYPNDYIRSFIANGETPANFTQMISCNDTSIEILNGEGNSFILELPSDAVDGALLVADLSGDIPKLALKRQKELATTYNLEVVNELPNVENAQMGVLYLLVS